MSKVPMNLIFPDRTAAGISRNEQGQRVIASTRRPDGTYRQEIKIRPGFTPQEDVALFRSQKQLDLDRHRAQKGTVPGLNPLVKNALDGMQQSKSAKKNQKRKENKAAAANNNNNPSSPPPKDSWDDDDDDTETVQGDKVGTTPTTAPESTTTTEDPTKRLRNLRKKLKQTEQLVAKQQDVAPTLSQAEQDKVDNLESLRKEIESLELNL